MLVKEMRNANVVRMLAIAIASLFMLGALISPVMSNPEIDESILNSAQSHDTSQFSYFENQSSKIVLGADRTVELTLKDSATGYAVPNVNVTVSWKTGTAFLFGGDWKTGAFVGFVIAAILVSIITAGAGAPLMTALGAGLFGGVIGGIVGGVGASMQKNVGGTIEHLISDSQGKVRTTKSWQEDVTILVDLDSPETAIGGWCGFKPGGQPLWSPGGTLNFVTMTHHFMTADIMLVKSGGLGSLLNNLKIAQGKVGNLSVASTDDLGNYDSDPAGHFQTINMHVQANVDSYAETCKHSEWKEENFWNPRTTVYPDGKGSDVIWIESKRLFKVLDASGVTSLLLNCTYLNGTDEPVQQGAPAAAYNINDPSNNIVTIDHYATGKFIYYQWVWVVGKLDLENPTVTIKASLNSNLGVINAGWERITIPDQRHIITFTFSDTSLIGTVHHTVYAERGIPSVTASLEYNFYNIGGSVRVKGIGIRTTPTTWDTGYYGEVSLVPFNNTCRYQTYFTIEDNNGSQIAKSSNQYVAFNYAAPTMYSTDIDMDNITGEQSYRLTVNNKFFGAEMSDTLFYQLTDWDGHYADAVLLEKTLNDTFKVTSDGTYGNFNNANINKIQTQLADMNTKIAIRKAELATFINDNGASNYTDSCAKMIKYFEFFYGKITPYMIMSASEIGGDAQNFAEFRALCYACMYSFNHVYLYYSCAVAWLHGDIELCTDLDNMMKFENNLLDQYYFSLTGDQYWDLTQFAILFIALAIAGSVTYGFNKYYRTHFHTTTDEKKIMMIMAGVFIASFLISFAVMWFVFYGALYSIFGHIKKLW